MIRTIILIVLISGISFKGKTQDAHLSLYDAAPLFLNPALTGVFEGTWRLHAQYRTQWKAVNFKPYTNALISFDKPYKKWGFGGQITNFRAGIGNFNAFQGTFSTAYSTSIDKAKRHNISFGIQAGLSQKTIEFGLLSYDNQYTTQNGGGFDQTISSGENFAGTSIIVPVTNAGFLYFFASQQSRLNPFVGFSAFNLITPKETYLGADNRLPIRYYAHVGTRINITEQLYLIPKALMMQQLEFMEQTYAIDAGYYLKGADLYLLGGVVYRNSDAFIITVGAKMDAFIAKVGYDVNVSSLSTVSTGRGGLELSFTYMGQKKKPKTEKICPRL
ncbi:MAG: type IX secretion system PorP/SprF family membrane protein [Flavobacteriaceae bacterium]|jgi:type IX secretion system PorP/SprF family membrane protein